MLNTYKILAQINPNATTLTQAYQVPSYADAVISLISVCNQGANGTFRIAIRPITESISKKHYIFYDKALNANETFVLKAGISLSSRSYIQVYSSTSDFSFSIFGMQTN